METSSIQGPRIAVDMGGDEEFLLEEAVPLYPKRISVFGVQERRQHSSRIIITGLKYERAKNRLTTQRQDSPMLVVGEIGVYERCVLTT
jgi:hypothetical protein